jgi:hypothetical protein
MIGPLTNARQVFEGRGSLLPSLKWTSEWLVLSFPRILHKPLPPPWPCVVHTTASCYACPFGA